MRLSYLELRNYRRFRSLKLQLPDGVVGILGMNGVGKSTIIEAVAWAMFGNVEEVVRTGKESIRRTGAGPTESCCVMLEFELGGTEYRVEREMGGKSLSVRAVLKTKDKILAEDDKHVRRMMEQLVGMDHKSFFTSVFARQKELNALQSVQPSERKKVVLRMLRIDSLDTVLTDVRADKRDAMSRVDGARETLTMDDGRERDAVLKERLPLLEKTLEDAEVALKVSELKEKAALAESEKTKAKRDQIRKDSEAHDSFQGDLKKKQAAFDERRRREESLVARMAELDEALTKLPELEREDKEWESAASRKESLEKEKTKAEKAGLMGKELGADGAEEIRRLGELQKLRTELSSPDALLTKIEETESARATCQSERAERSGRIGELRAKATEKRDAAAKDSKKLEEIRRAGKDGTCPTCERRLEESYTLLVKKLEESSAEASAGEKDALARAAQLEAELNALASKEEALRKRRAAIDKDLAKLKQAEAAIESKEEELARLRGRIADRKKALTDLGEIRFSQGEYDRATADLARLKKSHDRYVGLRSLKNQRGNYAKDLDDVRGLISRVTVELEQLKGIVAQLAPKKAEYESVLKEYDAKMDALNRERDAVRKARSSTERARMDLESVRKDLDEIAALKKRIEDDRKRADALALLEEVMAGFKDHLMGRIAPALSELASKELEAMTGGRYSKVELSDNYEMSIEDQGVPYPIDRFSGGESDLANLSLRLAISRIIADRTGANPINFLILDEIFGSQDPNRKRSVMSALSRLSGQFRQIFLITHIEDVKDSMGYVVRVEDTDDGTSRAELVA